LAIVSKIAAATPMAALLLASLLTLSLLLASVVRCVLMTLLICLDGLDWPLSLLPCEGLISQHPNEAFKPLFRCSRE
jgi:hypothetical protein